MDPQVSASFIPKKPLTTDPRSGRSGSSILALISVLIFVMSLVAAGAAFAYTQYLKNSISSKSASLARAQSAYEPGVIEDLVRLDLRLTAGRTLLSKHLAPSAIFAFLSVQTLERVRFDSFSFVFNDERVGTIELTGEADNFSTIALQSDQFGASRVLKDLIFSNLLISPETGRVSFSVRATIDPALFLYHQNLGAAASQPTAPDSQVQQTSTNSPQATTTP